MDYHRILSDALYFGAWIMSQVRWGFMKFKADPEKVWNELQTLGEQYAPQDVLDYARKHKKSELHKCFDWDDTSAAEKWRRQQARFICNSLVVTVKREETEPQTFRIIQHDRSEKAYTPVTYIVENPDRYQILLERAKGELAAWRDRYQEIIELRNVISEIEKVL
jgi:hypothetical protein